MATGSSSPAGLDTDRAILDRVARGNEAGLERLYDRYAGAMFAVAYRITGERADAEEVVLDAFSQVWRESVHFRDERGSVAAWLTMICRSRALDLVRARGRRIKAVARATMAAPDDPPGLGGIGPSAGDVEQLEKRQVVAEALRILSAPQRQAIELAFYEGLSHSEIAERLNEPLGTVKTRVRLAMQRLRNALGPYYFEPSV